MPVDFVIAQFVAVTSDLPVAAVKTGMLADVEMVDCVSRLLRQWGPPHLVVDPVMVATSGDRLIDRDAVQAVRDTLIPLADLITPNLPEAAALLECEIAESEEQMRAQAEALLQFGCRAVLLKGGHGSGAEAVDILATAGGITRLSQRRIETSNTHGTGCTLAAAITAGLADGKPLEEAVARAKDFVWMALMAGAAQQVGSGNGPVNHMFSVHKSAGIA